jgi:single-strand DNA-binding protein
MNNWNFTGNLGKDAEQRFTASGDSVVAFSVGVKSGYGKSEATTWANCNLWGKRGESVLPYLNKGQLVGITGEVSLREWEDKEGGKRQNLDVNVQNVTLLGKGERKEEKREEKGSGKPASVPASEDDLPF